MKEVSSKYTVIILFVVFIIVITLIITLSIISSGDRQTLLSRADVAHSDNPNEPIPSHTTFTFSFLPFESDRTQFDTVINMYNFQRFFDPSSDCDRDRDDCQKYNFKLTFTYDASEAQDRFGDRDISYRELESPSNIVTIITNDTKFKQESVKGTSRKKIIIEGKFRVDEDPQGKTQTEFIVIKNMKMQNNIQAAHFVWMPSDMKLEKPKTLLLSDTGLALAGIDGLYSVQQKKVIPESDSEVVPFGGIKTTPFPESGINIAEGSMTLNLKLKFQGILKKPDAQYNSMPVKISIAGGSSVSPISPQIGVFTADDQGVWTGSVSFPTLSPGSNYRILVKGPKHLQKRICDANPSESYPGSYSCTDGKINLQAGVNSFDFSKIYQLAGDLPEQNGVQNGFTNSYDTSLIRNNLNSADPTILKFADLNLDGIVNTQDFSLAIAALEFRSDEQ